MTDFTQFEANKPSSSAGPLDCAAVDLWLAEAAEENLPSDTAAQMREHTLDCPACQQKLTQAQQGRNWLLVLKQEELEPPTELVSKILARTSGAPISAFLPIGGFDGEAKPSSKRQSGIADRNADFASHAEGNGAAKYIGTPATGSAIPAWQASSLAPRRKMVEPRLALVAAMAFFSITLTLNLMGVRVTKMRAADLEPHKVRREVTRQYAEANARVVRYYENLRIVYEVESRMQQLRRAADTTPSGRQSGSKQGKGSSDSSRDPEGPPGVQRDRMAGEAQGKHTVPTDPIPVATGPRMDVALRVARRPSGFGIPSPLEAPEFIHNRAPIQRSCLLSSLVASFTLQPARLASSCSLRTPCFSMRERRSA